MKPHKARHVRALLVVGVSLPHHESLIARTFMHTPPHRSHGWNHDVVTPDWPALHVTEVHALLDRFPALRGEVRIDWHSPRPFSAAARVHTNGSDVFVKRHHGRVRTPQALREEHAFITHLNSHGLPVPTVLADADGHTAIASGEWTYEVHTLATGLDVYRNTASWTPPFSLEHAHSAGQMLAQLHVAAADFDAPMRSTTLLVAQDTLLRAPDLIAAIEARCAARPALAEALHMRDWRRQISALLPRHAKLQPQLLHQSRLWTHGDWHVSNLFWQPVRKPAQVSSILDFGLCAPTFALFDLATAIERNAIAWLQLEQGMHAIYPDIALQLIAGYVKVLPLSPRQRSLLAELLPLVHLDFALSEVEYFHAITRKSADVELAWSAFFLGHAAWFDSAPGLQLLDVIRAPVLAPALA